MSDQQVGAGLGVLGEIARQVFQMAYVTDDAERARSAAQKLLGVSDFEVLDASLDVVDDAGRTVDEVRLHVSFAMDRALEIIQPIKDPIGLFHDESTAHGGLLRFHHVGAFVPDLSPAVNAAREHELALVRLVSPVMEVAFIDLGEFGGHRLEVLHSTMG